ncbi:unnamed protein product [Polarella glacialis]|uniref:Pentatricopeptide repeat-containing protein, chloroplastic n=2 Tax=Polarella glacialis TaxID=89957 RepID=A0A813EAD1_POLGL|nr:unnamed protein product [Polarella glacialis]
MSACPSAFHPWCLFRCCQTSLRSPAACPLCRASVVPADLFPDIDVNHLNKDGMGAIHFACVRDNAKVLEVLIKWGCNIELESQNDGFSARPLHYAVFAEHASHIKVLLAARARVDALNSVGKSPLEIALELARTSGHSDCHLEEIVRLLESAVPSTMNIQRANELREQGNSCFKNEDFYGAVNLYGESIEAHGADSRTYANRAAAWLKLSRIITDSAEKHDIFSRSARDAMSCVGLDPSSEKGYFRSAVALMGCKHFALAMECVQRGLQHCPGSSSLRLLARELQARSVPVHRPQSGEVVLPGSGDVAAPCNYCHELLLVPFTSVCPRCGCEPAGAGMGDLLAKYGVEWAMKLESETFQAEMEIEAADMDAGLEASIREADDRAVDANATLSAAIFESRRVPLCISLLEYCRSPQTFREVFLEGASFEACRQGLRETEALTELWGPGGVPELVSGAKLLVHPEQAEALLLQLRSGFVQIQPDRGYEGNPQEVKLRPRHVIVSEDFEPALLEAIAALPGRGKERISEKQRQNMTDATSSSSGDHGLQEDATDEPLMPVSRTFIHFPEASSIWSGPTNGQKTSSTTTAPNPRFVVKESRIVAHLTCKSAGSSFSGNSFSPRQGRSHTNLKKNNNNNDSKSNNNKKKNNRDNNDNSILLQRLLDLGRAPCQDEVLEVLAVELGRWKQKTPACATVVLSFLARHRRPCVADHVLALMLEGRLEVNVFHCSAAISACEKGGQWQLALSLLRTMPDMRVTPNEVSYSAAISACEKGGQWQLALSLLNIMPDMQLMPNKFSYSAAISACEKGGQWQLALSLLTTMPEIRVMPNEVCYNAAISSCGAKGQWQLALSLLSTMPVMQLMPDRISFSASISACEKGGEWQVALRLLTTMPHLRLMPEEITYSAAISACEKEGEWQIALRLLSTMSGMRLLPDKITYSAAISACEKVGQWQLALSLLGTMPNARVMPNEVSYSAAISACEKGGRWQLALSLLNIMPKMRAMPNEISYNAAISACIHGANEAT